MRSLARRLVPLSIALALAGTTLVAGASTATAAAPIQTAAKPRPTEFGMVAVAIGTRVLGGAVPVESTQTGAQVLSCTNLAGLDKRNGVANVNLPGLGTARAVSSRTFTTKRGNTVTTTAEHSIARLTIVDTPLGSIDINGLSSTAITSNNGQRFTSSTDASIGSLTYTPPNGGNAVRLPLPTLARPVTVPGLARISLGVPSRTATANGATAETSVLNIAVYPTNTRAVIGQVKSQMSRGVKSGLFGGNAVGLRGTVLQDLIELGRTPLVNMPCTGTNGNVRTERVAGLNVPGLIEVGALESGVFGKQTGKRSDAQGASRVARVSLAGGRVVVNGINGVARVSRLAGGRLTRSTAGTGIGELVIDGEARRLPLDGLEIPGLLKLESNVVSNNPRGVNVVGLRITLLDGTGAVIDLASVDLAVRNAKLNKKKNRNRR